MGVINCIMKNNENLFDLAIGWYRSGEPGRKAAALDLFPESMLEKEIEAYKKRDKKERMKTREQELEVCLEKAKSLFPVGTLIISDDGTDHCPNLIVGEPYIGNTKYNSHIPYGIYEYSDKEEEQKTILVHTIRIYLGSEEDGPKWYRSIVGLEKLMINMDKPLDERYPKVDSYFIKLDDYCKSETEKKKKNIQDIKSEISELNEKIDRYSKDLSTWENYDPDSLTKEKIKEMVNKYKW